MKPQWESFLPQLNSAFQLWQDNCSGLPASFIYQGINIPTSELNIIFSEIYGSIELISNSEDINPLALAMNQQNIINNIPNISQAVTNMTANPQASFEQLISYLWSIKSSLVWIMPVGSNKYFENHIQNTNVIGMIESTNNLINQVKNLSESGNNSFNKITNIEQNAQETLVQISKKLEESEAASQDFLSKISGYEREASNAKTNTEASASSALTNKETIESLLEKLSNGLTQQQTAQEKINTLSNEAELVLEGTSKVGLAASFRIRRERLEISQILWGFFFTLGISLLIAITIATSTGNLELPILINENGQVNPWAAIVRVLITGPAVWFTWFAARQYGFTIRLIEDYAFKEASALAFVGYKREMGDDSEMLKLLRETAIKNFGSSPTRMLSKSDPSSPVHELVDRALENQGIFDKVLQLFKALKPEKN
jgi:hypothetical protein